MKHSDEKPLLKKILDDDIVSDLRRTSLDRALGAMRQERQRRRTLRVGSLMLLPLALVAALVWLKPALKSIEPRVSQVSHPTPLAADASQKQPIKTISDEELFALFPGRSLALIGKPGHQELVFLDAPVRN
jgi:hypothetical protein